MKNSYKKTKWVDNKTPVCAQNLNKIENALSEIYEKCPEKDSFKEGNGILFDNDDEGNTVIGVDSTVLTSITCTGIEVVTEEPLNPIKNKMYFVLNQDMYLSKVQMNGITLFEI